MKTCSICKIERRDEMFPFREKKIGLRRGTCKICRSTKPMTAEQKERYKIYREQNKEKIRERQRAWELENREWCNLKKREWAEKNKDRVIEQRNRHYQENKDKRSESDKIKRMTDPLHDMKIRVRNRINVAIKRGKFSGKTNGTLEIIGCSWDDLKIFIESKFTEGMTWENRGKWHIDHIIPLSSAKTIEEMIQLCHYSNLQPLWANDNISKGAKIL